MFKKLRNRIIVQNMLITSAIVVVAFTAIFCVVLINSRHSRPIPPKEFDGFQEMREVFMNEIESEREAQLARLAWTLVLVGVSVELLVFAASYYFAEKSIEPVKAAYKKQREFIANASHELKTPIASIQANFEALDINEEPWKTNIETELTRASNLVGDLLTLARTDGRMVKVSKKSVKLSKAVQKRAQLIEARLGEKKLECDISEDISITMNEADFAQVLDILLDNAVKYSKKWIKVSYLGNRLVVENDGKTIAKTDLEKVFDRFYQTDKTAEGSGLGLAIAKAVCEQNGWKIRAESENKITRFSVLF